MALKVFDDFDKEFIVLQIRLVKSREAISASIMNEHFLDIGVVDGKAVWEMVAAIL